MNLREGAGEMAQQPDANSLLVCEKKQINMPMSAICESEGIICCNARKRVHLNIREMKFH